MLKFTLILVMITLLSHCKSTSNIDIPDINTMKTIDADTLSADFLNDGAIENHCFYPRKTVRSIQNEAGIITIIDSTYIISSASRYQPCEIPIRFRKEGLPVLFSGDKLEQFPYEHRTAIPFRLTKLTAKK